MNLTHQLDVINHVETDMFKLINKTFHSNLKYKYFNSIGKFLFRKGRHEHFQ